MTLIMSMKLGTQHRAPREATNLNSDIRYTTRRAPGPRIPGTQAMLVFGMKQENRKSFTMDCVKSRARVGESLDNADESHASGSRTKFFGCSSRVRSLAFMTFPVT